MTFRSASVLALAAVLSALVSVPAPAVAQARHAPQNLLTLGRQQYDNLRYEEAIQTLSAAIIRSGNTPDTEIQIYLLLALSYQALNRTDEAEGAYRLVLARDPEHQLSNDIAPRIVEFFTGVRRRWDSDGRPGIAQRTGTNAVVAATAPVTIEHRSPAQGQRNRAVPLAATVVDPDHRVARLVLAYRTGSHGLFRRVDTMALSDGRYEATLPAEAIRPPLVEYYFEAVDANGVPVQARGDAFAPLRVAVPEPGGVPWWVWAGGGAVVVGATVAVIVVATSAQPGHLVITLSGN